MEEQENKIEREELGVELAEIRQEAERNIAERMEKRTPEKAVDKQKERENAKHEALEQAKETKPEKQSPSTKEKVSKKPEHNNKTTRKRAYDNIMRETREQMSPTSKAFSHVIHSPVVEKTSEVVGNTVARPNAILAGAVSASLLVLGVYLVARNYGYPLSGTESVLAFAIGWLIGILYDFLHNMITGGTH